MKPHAFMAALALVAAGAAHAAVTEFILYKQPNFRGPAQTVKGEVNVLENGYAGEAESLVVRGGYWLACTGDRFTGTCRVFEPGEYPVLGSEINRKITSVRFLGTDPEVARRAEREARRDEHREARNDRFGNRHGAIELYGRESFNGRSIRIEENVPDLYEHRFDGRASSAIVREGTWELCSREDYEGTCRTLVPGQYPRLAGLDDRVTSLRQVR